MKTKTFLLTVAILFSLTLHAQLSINNQGMVTITANTNDWYSGLKVVLPTYNSCAFNLDYGGHDRFFVHASGYLWCERGGYFGSDTILKENIKKIDSPLDKLKMLNGYEYNFKNSKQGTKSHRYNNYDESDEKRLGVIAQEVELVFPGIVKTIPNGTKAVSYADLTALLIESIKEQQLQIEALQKIVYSHEQEIIRLKNTHEEYALYDDKSKQEPNKIARLYDNIPNPFNQKTEIKYELSDDVDKAELIICDLQGKIIKSYNLQQIKHGSVTIDGFELKAGMYLYTLIVNNIVVDTKKMILTKD